MTDAELLARFARHADQAAFAEVVRRHAGLVIATARRNADPADADDVAQATFWLLSQRAGRLLGHRSVAGWLYETTRRCAANARRSRRRHDARVAAIAKREAATATVSVGEASGLLDAALAKLPDAIRDVVLLRHAESLSVAETAERLGVPATTVTKRSERGLARLRDFFADRGHASLGTAGVASLIAAPAVEPTHAASLATAATGTTAPAAVTTIAAGGTVPWGPLVAGGAAAALVTIAAVAAVHHPSVGATTRAASPAGRPVVAASPTTVTAGLTQDDARAVATTFFDCLRARDAAGVAALLTPEALDARGKDTGTSFQDGLIRLLRDGWYKQFPERLSLYAGGGSFQLEPTIFNGDGTTQPTSPGGPHLAEATLEAQTPMEAEVGRAVLKLKPVDGAWRVSFVAFVTNGAAVAGQLQDLAAATTTQPVDLAAARRASDAWNAFDSAFVELPDLATRTDADLPAVRAATAKQAAAFDRLVEAMRDTPVSFADADVQSIRSTFADVNARLDRAPTMATYNAWSRDPATLRRFNEVLFPPRVETEQLENLLDAAEEARPTTPRPASIGPGVPVTLAWRPKDALKLRGPLVFPAWLRQTRAWKRWQIQHDIKTFRTRDDAGNVYEVEVHGAYRMAGEKPDAPAHESVPVIRMYRPNGTLAAVAEYFDGHLSRWGEFDETGHRFTYRATADVRNLSDPVRPIEKTRIDEVNFFAPDGSIRNWYTSQDDRNRVWREQLENPLGGHELTLHLVRNSGTDDGDPAEDLPIDGLPIEIE